MANSPTHIEQDGKQPRRKDPAPSRADILKFADASRDPILQGFQNANHREHARQPRCAARKRAHECIQDPSIIPPMRTPANEERDHGETAKRSDVVEVIVLRKPAVNRRRDDHESRMAIAGHEREVKDGTKQQHQNRRADSPAICAISSLRLTVFRGLGAIGIRRGHFAAVREASGLGCLICRLSSYVFATLRNS